MRIRHLLVVLGLLILPLMATPTAAQTNPITLTIIYDNYAYVDGMETDWGFAALRTWSLFCVAGISALWLVRIEKRTPSPIFDPGLMKIRLFILPIIAAMILFAGLFTIVFLMPFFLVNPSARSVDQAAYMMVIPFVFLFFVSPLSGTLSDRMGSRLLCTLGMGVLAMALCTPLAMIGKWLGKGDNLNVVARVD